MPTLAQQFAAGAKQLSEFNSADLYSVVRELHLAYRLDQPLVSDEVFDLVESRLLAENPNAINEIEAEITPELFRNSVRLPINMPGLTQVGFPDQSEEANDELLGRWTKTTGSKSFLVTGKLDGVSCMLVYSGGKFRKGFTKHSGTHGLDITRHLRSMGSVPKTVERTDSFYVRGELIISIPVFQEKYSEEYKNPRNFVAGKINAIETPEQVLSDIRFEAYSLYGESEGNRQKQLVDLSALGFNVVGFQPLMSEAVTASELSSLIRAFKGQKIYEYDGVVVSPMSGSSDSVKYKLQGEVVETTVVGVDWALHKDGHWRPTVVVEPVELVGVTVSRASGFHARYIAEGRLPWEDKPVMPIGPGAIITIMRSGDVIPDIQSVVKAADEPAMPTEGWEWEEGDNPLHAVTSDMNHPMIKQKRLSYFCNTVGVEGLRETTLARILEKYPELDILSLVKLSQSELETIFTEATASKLKESLDSALNGVYLPTLLAATNIMGRLWAVGRFEKVYEWFEGDMLDWNLYSREEIVAELVEIPSIGNTLAETFADNWQELSNAVHELELAGVKVQPYVESSMELESNKLQGKRFVFTGIRDAKAEAYIVANGGELGTWSSSNVIVAKDTSVLRPKIQKLIDRGAEFIDLASFWETYGEI